jgi:hypothetical protein
VIQAREADVDNMDMMDYYAVLLRQKGTGAHLNSLAHKLMAVDQRRPEVRYEEERILLFNGT